MTRIQKNNYCNLLLLQLFIAQTPANKINEDNAEIINTVIAGLPFAEKDWLPLYKILETSGYIEQDKNTNEFLITKSGESRAIRLNNIKEGINLQQLARFKNFNVRTTPGFKVAGMFAFGAALMEDYEQALFTPNTDLLNALKNFRNDLDIILQDFPVIVTTELVESE